jgi:hypothetical protein
MAQKPRKRGVFVVTGGVQKHATGSKRGPNFFGTCPEADAGLTADQIQNILIGIAPVVGTPRTLAAALKITEALGIAIVALEELEAEQGEE